MSFKLDLNAIKKAPKLSAKASKTLHDKYIADVKLQDDSIFKPIFPVEANVLSNDLATIKENLEISDKYEINSLCEATYYTEPIKSFDSTEVKLNSDFSEYSGFYTDYEVAA